VIVTRPEYPEHPIDRFPVWCYGEDGLPMPFTDSRIGDVMASANHGYLNFEIFYHAEIAKALTGNRMNTISMGLSRMPPEVSAALRSGEMRYLQKLAGYTEIRFRQDGTLESTLGCDGWRNLWDESGRTPIAAQFLNGEIELLPLVEK
jgi:hypothetical protein